MLERRMTGPVIRALTFEPDVLSCRADGSCIRGRTRGHRRIHDIPRGRWTDRIGLAPRARL